MRTQVEHFHKRARLYVLGAAILILLFALLIPNATAKVVLIILTIIAFAVLVIVEWLKKDEVATKQEDAKQAKASAERQKLEETKRKAEEVKKAEEIKKAEEARKAEEAKKPKPAPKKKAAPDDGVTTRTGQYCVEDGTYHCSEHPDRTVEMVVGKRFPPCRGDGRGHSAIWTLSK